MNEILNKIDFVPLELITYLKSLDNLNGLYQLKVRHYTLEQHTLLVMNEFEKHYSKIDIVINKDLFRLMLALHDIGKPRAYLEGNINNQYGYTVEIINRLRSLLPFSKTEIDLCIALVSTDTLGMYLRGQLSIENAKHQIIDLTSKTNFNNIFFFNFMVIYYQCDIAGYTTDAGGLAYLEYLFEYKDNKKVFDIVNRRLKFSPIFETKFVELEKFLKL